MLKKIRSYLNKRKTRNKVRDLWTLYATVTYSKKDVDGYYTIKEYTLKAKLYCNPLGDRNVIFDDSNWDTAIKNISDVGAGFDTRTVKDWLNGINGKISLPSLQDWEKLAGPVQKADWYINKSILDLYE